eukprot:TRINITY_DN4657_c0_g2_i2.p1 TRINITY_DN4657_c0_g2~~TRINITY_DN4657_c0_g2_i2.p1  ORF type:complete len:617 (+),score=160.39 TRINITY_DN4657_c0_g2_i2:219-2069(+)
MGAMTEPRATEFRERYESFGEKERPFHYGSHYSSSAVVVYFLMRVEPFATHFLALHEGRWDHPDRLFHSLHEAWVLSSSGSTSHVMELIPELFYLPELFRNENKFSLGTKQNHEVIDYVVLPPWARGSPRLFVRKHMQALESPYVSEHLNDWIDLIWGYKQRGKAAEEAMNVFHYSSYEGEANPEAIEDPLQRKALLDMILNFGQTPSQLWDKTPHPKRAVPTTGTSTSASASTSPVSPPSPAPSPPPGLAGGAHHVPPPRPPPPPPSTTPPLEKPAAVPAIPLPQPAVAGAVTAMTAAAPQPVYSASLICSQPSKLMPVVIRDIGEAVGDIRCLGDKVFTVRKTKVMLPPTFIRHVVWGYADGSMRMWSGEKMLSIIEHAHDAPVTCMAAVEGTQLLVSGSDDATVKVLTTDSASGGELVVLATMYAHRDSVTCLAVSRTYSIVVSGSRDNTCVIWDLNHFAYVRQLSHGEAPLCIDIHEVMGDIVVCSAHLIRLWSVNGELLAHHKLQHQSKEAITCCSLYKAQDSIVLDHEGLLFTGHVDGSIRVWVFDANVTADTGGNTTLITLLLHVLETGFTEPITCLHVTPDKGKLYSGDAKGLVTWWTVPELRVPTKR